jgi:hypothetical protein
VHSNYTRPIFLLSVLAAQVTACAPAVTSKNTGSNCKGADSVSVRIHASISDLLLSTDSADIAMRDTVGIAGVLPSQVVLISDSRLCSKLAAAIDQLEHANKPGRLFYAFSVGRVFAALDPTIRAGEWIPLLFYDAHFKLLWSVAVF